MSRAAARLALGLGVAVALAGCGYQLRDDAALTALLAAPRIIDQADDPALARALRRQLRDSGARVDPPAAASGEIHLLRAALTRESLSIGIDGQADEVRLTYTLRYRFGPADAADPTAWRRRTVTVRDSYRFDAAGLLGAAAEARRLQTELKRRAARRVVTQIRLLARSP